jgi:hypothetical protein
MLAGRRALLAGKQHRAVSCVSLTSGGKPVGVLLEIATVVNPGQLIAVMAEFDGRVIRVIRVEAGRLPRRAVFPKRGAAGAVMGYSGS